MANILYLVHRIPFPPNKGDKVRSFHLLRHLAERHQVYLGTFIDDPNDNVYQDRVRDLCADACFVPLNPVLSRLASLRGLLTGEPLTLPYYRQAALAKWVQQVMQGARLDAAVIFSSCMAQYTEGVGQLPVVTDFVDVDSAKWTDYAPNHRWPMSWLYAREGRRLLAYERSVAARSIHGFFATASEAALFLRSAPEASGRVSAMNNGVDAEFFSPSGDRPTPFLPGEVPLVFTGAMDYWPNVDAVTWFAREMLPELRRSRPALTFHIVGRSPTPAVQALASDAVRISGTVPDVRPYLQHAAVVVAPLRLARGIQNKVLEAMAAGRPVVSASACVEALSLKAGEEIMSAETVEEFTAAVGGLLDAPDRAQAIGNAGRRRVLRDFTWEAHLQGLDRQLDSILTAPHVACVARPSASPREVVN